MYFFVCYLFTFSTVIHQILFAYLKYVIENIILKVLDFILFPHSSRKLYYFILFYFIHCHTSIKFA